MPKNKHKVLVVDDEPDIVELIKYNLEKEGFEVKTATDGMMAVEKAKKFEPDAILLDIMMPEMDGVEACRQLRKIPSLDNVYILFLTARVEEYSEVAAFEAGADDYITKPVKPRALISRMNAVFRREKTKDDSTQDVIQVRDFEIDKSSYKVTQRGETLNLPKKEFELLCHLAEAPNKFFTRNELLDNIWGSDVYVLPRTVDVHIRRLREKIGDGYIKTMKGVGYKFETES